MIISHQHRFVFLAVPRTGSHAVREALRPQLAVGDLEQELLTQDKLMPWPAIAALGHGHIQAKQIKPFLKPEIWSDYYKFAFVRNPWDRFVSACSFYSPAKFGENPHRCIRELMFVKKAMKHFLFRPQTEILLDEGGQLMVDFIGKYETLEKDFNHIINEIGLPSTGLTQINGATHLQYKQYYTEDLIENVRPLVLKDLEYFDYPDKP